MEITKNTDNNKSYYPNLESNGAKLKEVTITPGTTEVVMDIPKEMGVSAFVMVYDDHGKKLQGLGGRIYDSEIGKLYDDKFESAVSNDIKYLTVKIVDKSTNKLPILAEFKVNLDK